jgi:IMP dehydrogenase
MKMKKALSYDDVLLLPQYSNIRSRKEIDISAELSPNIKLSLPIIASPMDTISGFEMAMTLSRHGGLAIIHRYMDIVEQVQLVSDIKKDGNVYVGAAVGTGDDAVVRAQALIAAGVDVLCIDVAHGHHELVRRTLENIRSKAGASNTHIMAGNVATPQAVMDLSSWGADSIRIGIGGGSICSTRIQTGHGMPTFQSVLDCSQAAETANVKLIADGGIKNSGDVVKSIAAGADFVMLGSVLSGTDECPGRVVSMNGQKYKEYRGMASAEAQLDWRGRTASLEGVASMVPYRGSVTPILQQLDNGIRSGFSYSGARSMSEFMAKCQFIEQTAAGQLESSTHIKVRYG